MVLCRRLSVLKSSGLARAFRDGFWRLHACKKVRERERGEGRGGGERNYDAIWSNLKRCHGLSLRVLAGKLFTGECENRKNKNNRAINDETL